MSKSKNPNEIAIPGSVTYMEPPHFFTKHAGLVVTFWREGDKLTGSIRFSLGAGVWNADIPPTTVEGDSFPELTVLRDYARQVILRYLQARSYVNREIKLGSPK